MDDIRMTEDALIEALREALAGGESPGGFMTTVEIREATGRSSEWVLKGLHRLKDQGQLEVQTVNRVNITGSTRGVPGYRIIPDDLSD